MFSHLKFLYNRYLGWLASFATNLHYIHYIYYIYTKIMHLSSQQPDVLSGLNFVKFWRFRFKYHLVNCTIHLAGRILAFMECQQNSTYIIVDSLRMWYLKVCVFLFDRQEQGKGKVTIQPCWVAVSSGSSPPPFAQGKLCCTCWCRSSCLPGCCPGVFGCWSAWVGWKCCQRQQEVKVHCAEFCKLQYI